VSGAQVTSDEFIFSKIMLLLLQVLAFAYQSARSVQGQFVIKILGTFLCRDHAELDRLQELA